MIFALQKFCHYLLANPFIFYKNHQALKYLVYKPLHHSLIYQWSILFQDFEFKVVIRPGHTNVRPDHLLRIQMGEESSSIENDLLDAHLFKVETIPKELADIVQFLQE